MDNTLTEATNPMFLEAKNRIKLGITEREIMSVIWKKALENGNGMAFQPIVSVRGEILHNPNYNNILKKDHLLVMDAGAESMEFYATDITRTYPVSGKFTQQQRNIYQIVLDAQKEGIDSIKPGETYKHIHMNACLVIIEGLKLLNLLHGDNEEIYQKGAHALFMPHGLGHMIGLDVHDMENLGENFVGYDEKVKREKIFGLSNLRLGKELKENFTITVEPGIYFIPGLIAKWEKEKKFKEHINYKLLDTYSDFGGIRIEDNVVVTKEGCEILGKPIPKDPVEIES